MAEIEAIQTLGLMTFRSIEMLQDFHVFTGHSYDRYGKMVEAGHITGSVTNVRTRSNVPCAELASHLMSYLDDDLPRVVLYQQVAYFEFFVFDLLRLLLRHNPRALGAKRELTVGDVLDAEDKGALVDFLVERQVREAQYKNVREWFDYLGKIVNVPAPPDASIDRIAELKATRDLLAHNNGIVNDVYVRKAGGAARAKLGDEIPVTRGYVYDAADFLRAFVQVLTEDVCARLDRDSRPPAPDTGVTI